MRVNFALLDRGSFASCPCCCASLLSRALRFVVVGLSDTMESKRVIVVVINSGLIRSRTAPRDVLPREIIASSPRSTAMTFFCYALLRHARRLAASQKISDYNIMRCFDRAFQNSHQQSGRRIINPPIATSSSSSVACYPYSLHNAVVAPVQIYSKRIFSTDSVLSFSKDHPRKEKSPALSQ